jgi:hypothetical protein
MCQSLGGCLHVLNAGEKVVGISIAAGSSFRREDCAFGQFFASKAI